MAHSLTHKPVRDVPDEVDNGTYWVRGHSRIGLTVDGIPTGERSPDVDLGALDPLPFAGSDIPGVQDLTVRRCKSSDRYCPHNPACKVA